MCIYRDIRYIYIDMFILNMKIHENHVFIHVFIVNGRLYWDLYIHVNSILISDPLTSIDKL